MHGQICYILSAQISTHLLYESDEEYVISKYRQETISLSHFFKKKKRGREFCFLKITLLAITMDKPDVAVLGNSHTNLKYTVWIDLFLTNHTK